MKRNILVSRVFLYLFLIIVSFICVFPFYWMIVGSTNTPIQIIAGKMTFGSHFVENFHTLFNNYNMLRILMNSLKISGISVILILLIGGMAGYGFQMYKSNLKEKLYGFFQLTMMVPFATLMIPLFKIVTKLNLLDTHFAVIIVSAVSAFMIFFFRQSFVNYPTEILEAARVDGAGEFRIFFNIFVPSMKSTFAAAAIYSFITSWNSYLWPLIVLQSNDKKTTTLLISMMSSSYTPEYGVIMLAIVVATLPTIIIFFAFQKQFVQGMLGSVKQ